MAGGGKILTVDVVAQMKMRPKDQVDGEQKVAEG